MNRTTRQTFVACIATLLLTPLAALQAAEAPRKSLPLSGEVFLVEGRTAFVILPEAKPASRPIPWVWYAPTLPDLPGDAEKWMFERFTQCRHCHRGHRCRGILRESRRAGAVYGLLQDTDHESRFCAEAGDARAQPGRPDGLVVGRGECRQGCRVRGHLPRLQRGQLPRRGQGKRRLRHDRGGTCGTLGGAQSHRPACRAGQSRRSAVRHPRRQRQGRPAGGELRGNARLATRLSAARCNSSSRPARDTTCGKASSNARNWWTSSSPRQVGRIRRQDDETGPGDKTNPPGGANPAGRAL